MKHMAPDQRLQTINLKWSKQSPTRSLSRLIAQHSSGCLVFHDPQDMTVGWRVYFGDGQIHFAESTIGQQERLAYLLQRHAPLCKLPQPSRLMPDSEVLDQILKSQQLTLKQFRELLACITQEALSHLLAIPQPLVTFDAQAKLSSLLLSVPLWKHVWSVKPRIDQWSLMHPELCSAFQRPFIRDWDKFMAFLSYMKGAYCRLSHLTVALKQNLSLYQLASRFNMDVEDLAISIHPLIKCGAVGINPYQGVPSSARTRITCIDEDLAIQSLVRRTLAPHGHDIVAITDITCVFTALAQQPPDLILMNHHLPQIDGADLCRLLRRVEALQELPIVMLKQPDRLMGSLRTRRCGSTAVLPKPLQPEALQALVHQLLPENALRGSMSSSGFIYA